MMPVLLMERPVSAGVAEPEANSRLNLPKGLAVLFPTGSACQRKCWLRAAWVLVLKTEANASSGWEMNPFVAVAVPVAGNCKVPRMKAPPLTSNVPAGWVLPMPTFPPIWKMMEFPRVLLLVQMGMKLVVPLPPTAGRFKLRFRPADDWAGDADCEGVASTKAETGNPAIVSASAAFMA